MNIFASINEYLSCLSIHHPSCIGVWFGERKLVRLLGQKRMTKTTEFRRGPRGLDNPNNVPTDLEALLFFFQA